jgi:predicted lipoprotein with Yx(FWY)xxD motif
MAIVTTSHNPKLGVIIVDDQGRTLYTLTNAGKPVACTSTCTRFWPPLLLPAGDTTPAGTGVTGLKVVAMNGGEQVAFQGDPLYRFAGDMKAGDTNGQGITSFGGTWHAAATASGATPAPATTPPATGSGGYSYP